MKTTISLALFPLIFATSVVARELEPTKAEVKVSYPCSLIEKNSSLEGLALEKSEGEIRFYKNYPTSIVVRARFDKTAGKHDFTIKLRPFEPKDLSQADQDFLTGPENGVREYDKTTPEAREVAANSSQPKKIKKQLKCERDVSILEDSGTAKTQADMIKDRSNISCSLTIKGASSHGSLTKAFLKGNQLPDPVASESYRPIQSTEWNLDPVKLNMEAKDEVTLERWQVTPDTCFLELSAKTSVDKMEDMGRKLVKGLTEALGTTPLPSSKQGNKTAQTLDIIRSISP